MKLSAHFDLLNERPRCRDRDGDGGEFIGYTPAHGAVWQSFSVVPIRRLGKIGYLC